MIFLDINRGRHVVVHWPALSTDASRLFSCLIATFSAARKRDDFLSCRVVMVQLHSAKVLYLLEVFSFESMYNARRKKFIYLIVEFYFDNK